MTEFIDRSKLEFDFRQCNRTNSKWTPHRVVQMIHRQPIADVAPVVHGRWIYEPVEFSLVKDICCSVCRRYVQVPENYCPDCGARMDLEEPNETKET